MSEQTLAEQAGYTPPFKADADVLEVMHRTPIKDAKGRVVGTCTSQRLAIELADELNRDGCISSIDYP